MTKLNKTLSEFGQLLPWLENVKGLESNNLWLKPIAEHKWSVREILTHIMNWDKNSLQMMVPNMIEGASLSFIDIENYNKEATVLAQNYTNLESLINDVVKTRQQLLDLLQERYDDSLSFRIDNSKYTYKKFVNVFIHHDQHHIEQMERFMRSQNITS